MGSSSSSAAPGGSRGSLGLNQKGIRDPRSSGAGWALSRETPACVSLGALQSRALCLLLYPCYGCCMCSPGLEPGAMGHRASLPTSSGAQLGQASSAPLEPLRSRRGVTPLLGPPQSLQSWSPARTALGAAGRLGTAGCFQRPYLKHGSGTPAPEGPALPRLPQPCCKEAGPLHQLLLPKHRPRGPSCFSAGLWLFLHALGPSVESLWPHCPTPGCFRLQGLASCGPAGACRSVGWWWVPEHGSSTLGPEERGPALAGQWAAAACRGAEAGPPAPALPTVCPSGCPWVNR